MRINRTTAVKKAKSRRTQRDFDKSFIPGPCRKYTMRTDLTLCQLLEVEA
jgi:hypothetical protein